MSGRRRTRDNVGVNLFPFLAVLICTMGALIMLLVVMVQQARRATETSVVTAAATLEVEDTADAESRKQRVAEHERKKGIAAKAQQEVEDFKWQTSVLQPSYEQTIKQLAEKRLALSHLEAHTRELSEIASVMQTEADMIAAAARDDSNAREREKQDLEQLKSQIASASRELQTVKEQLDNHVPKHTLIPYDGPNGTTRPPIYVECLSDRVVLQPENVQLIGEDFREPLTTENPLALALRAKREFMFANGLLEEGSEPYPLLVVRPGSAASYAAARSAMKAWEAEFGYELIESDLELDYHVADPRLTQLLSDVVIEARGKRRLLRSMRSISTRRRELLRPSSSGGFETVSSGSRSYATGHASSRNSSGRNYGAGAGGVAAEDPFGNGTGAADPTSEGTGNSPKGSHDGGSESDDGQQFGTGQYGQGPPSGEVSGTLETRIGRGGSDGDPRFSSPGGNVSAGGGEGRGGSSTTASGSGGQGSNGGGGSGAKPSSSAGQSTGFDATQSLSQTRGSSWALPDSPINAVGILRPVKVICDRRQLILVPEKGTREEVQIFRHGGSIPAVVDPFVAAVRTRLESWGIAGQGIYWRPLLRVQVNDNAVDGYRRLSQLLDNSGIEVTREP